MTITSSLRFLYIFWKSGLLCGAQFSSVVDDGDARMCDGTEVAEKANGTGRRSTQKRLTMTVLYYSPNVV